MVINPAVPNTAEVYQETDHNYGPFKSKFCQNHILPSLTLQPWLVWLVVFGSVDLVTGVDLKDCAMSVVFLRKHNLVPGKRLVQRH